MPLGYKTIWHDDWIVENYLRYPSYKALTDAYNETFGYEVAPTTMNGHCKNDLGLCKPRVTGEFLTEEQKKFIEEYYPSHSVKDTTRAFNETFGTNKQKHTMLNYARRHGLKVDEDVVTKSKIDAAHADGTTHPFRKIGDVRFDGRYWVMKTEEGWKMCHKAVWEKHHGKVAKGNAVIYLDGDNTNWNIDNLLEVPIRYLGLLDRNGMRSENAEITKTGVLWCELHDLVEREETE